MPASLASPALSGTGMDGFPRAFDDALSRREVLDDPAEWTGFSRPVAGREGWWESCLSITGMYCAACSLSVEQALCGLPGVDGVRVNGATATARLLWQPGVSRPSDWLRALKRAGYPGLPAGDMLADAPRLQAQRLLLWRWLVAGFCMMQVMMYATPAYVAAPGDITPDMQALLRWASWVLTLPVLLFACTPFFASALRDLRHRRIGMDVPVSLGILIAFGASSAATFDPASRWGAEVWYDSVTMFVFFLLSGRLLEQRLRDRTAGSLEALMRRLPDSVERQAADGRFERVAVRRLRAGDLIRVLPGEVIPADGQVRAGESRVDEALLTGESTPLQRVAGSTVIAGSHNLTGRLLVQVASAGKDTRYAAIVALMEQASVQKPELAQIADRIASPFLLGVVLASAGAAAWWWASDPAHAIGVAVAVLIVTCPCALSLATPAATLAAAGALARRGVMVRRLQALEACAAVDTVVFDKTGTLTDAHMKVVRVSAPAGVDTIAMGRLAAALASQSLHPLSRALAESYDADGVRVTQVREVAGSGVQALVGAGDGLAARTMFLGSAVFCGFPAVAHNAGGPQVHLADTQRWLASFAFDEGLRPDAAAAVQALLAQGCRVALLSGDQQGAVNRLGARVGIADCWGERSPEGKLAHLQQRQLAGHRVLMVGDGMNDGPVLACADVSIAMGQAVPLAQAKSDFVVLGGQLSAVPALLELARRTRRVVRQNLAWAAVYNAVCVPLAVAGLMPPWLAGLGMAGSSLLVVLNSARLSRAHTGG
ncbi:MAG: cadmium-translocating P-type ATPase [Haliea sp.]|nr:MAG: cadmium-translocating P-type ATPase [Haliea sp.]